MVFFILVILTFVLSTFVTDINPSLSYYTLPTRMWAMLSGGLAYFLSEKYNYRSNTIGYIGVAIIICSMIFLSDVNGWPNINSIYPVLGTVLVILFGLDHNLLSNKYISVWGSSSYSLYLWHWPVSVYLYVNNLDEYKFIGIIISIMLSLFSYFIVEKIFCKGERVVKV